MNFFSLRCGKSARTSSISMFLEEPTTCNYILTVEAAFLCPLLQNTDEHGLFTLPQADPTPTEAPGGGVSGSGSGSGQGVGGGKGSDWGEGSGEEGEEFDEEEEFDEDGNVKEG